MTGSNAFFLTDSRYTSQAGSETSGYQIRTYAKPLDEIAALVKQFRIKTLGFESNHLSYDTYLRLRKALPKARVKPAGGIAGRLRAVKDGSEIALIRESAKVLDEGFALVKRLLKPGAVESEIALKIEFRFRARGAEATAFDTIIASGARGALPHGKASRKKIKKGELVVVDMGALKDGYNSDETRTFCVGRAGAEEKKIYKTVLDAQSRAIEMIRPGVKAVDVDAAARGHIAKAGYGKYFGHGLGHGVGLDIHEGPTLSPLSKDVLEEGMVVTVEPGIYVPGLCGVRIEDMALVTRDGCELLTKTPKDFVCL